MRKFYNISVLFIIFSIACFAQDAASYFPANPGFTWNFKVIPLDSVNNEIDSLTFYRVDSFAVAQNYQGMPANIILSKVKLSPALPFSPFVDSSFVALNGSDAYTYYKLFNIDSLINSLGSSNIMAKIQRVNDVSGWLSFYRFAQAENQSYQIFSLDTSVTYNNASLPVRFEIKGTRTADQTIQIENQTYGCKKFVIDNIVSYLLAPTIPLKLFDISDTVWIAPGQWIIQDIMPTNNLDLSAYGIGKLYIPGLKQVLTSQIPTGVRNTEAQINGFKLYQNYPNPFNPSTIIRYSLPEYSYVELTIYDILGNKVTTLVNKGQNAGNYEAEFNPSLLNGGLSTGVYFYTLKTGKASITKKLIYLK